MKRATPPTGCRKNQLHMRAYWVRRDTDMLWDRHPEGFMWNAVPSYGVSCGDPDRAGNLQLTILCADCCKQLGYLW